MGKRRGGPCGTLRRVIIVESAPGGIRSMSFAKPRTSQRYWLVVLAVCVVAHFFSTGLNRHLFPHRRSTRFATHIPPCMSTTICSPKQPFYALSLVFSYGMGYLYAERLEKNDSGPVLWKNYGGVCGTECWGL